jgi:hypothetical protein
VAGKEATMDVLEVLLKELAALPEPARSVSE